MTKSKRKVDTDLRLLLKMGIGNVIVLCQVVAFLISFIVSFFIFIPVSVNIREFKGHCLLGAEGVWSQNDTISPQLTSVKWGTRSDCGFNVFMGILVMILSIFYIVWESIYLYKNTDGSWLSSFLSCIVCLMICLMLFASSLILSVGLRKWCTFLTTPPSVIHQCEDSSYIPFIQDNDIYTNNFYAELTMAEFGSWICWICWVFLSVLAVIKVYRYHKHEAFMISMNRERQRLLHKVGHKDPVIM